MIRIDLKKALIFTNFIIADMGKFFKNNAYAGLLSKPYIAAILPETSVKIFLHHTSVGCS
jgi:hypothetical protein